MTPFGQRAVELVELARHIREALALRIGTCTFCLALAELRIFGEPRNFCAGELGLITSARRRSDCASRRGCFEPHTLEPGEGRYEDARLREQWRSRGTVPCGSHVDAITQRARNRGAPCERLRAQQDELPARQLFEGPENAAQ